MTVISVRAAGGPRLRLNRTQTRLFLDEFRRVRRLPASKGVLKDSGPDCKLTIRNGQSTRNYELYSRAVLHEPRTGRTWQFYFGLLILEWLYP